MLVKNSWTAVWAWNLPCSPEGPALRLETRKPSGQTFETADSLLAAAATHGVDRYLLLEAVLEGTVALGAARETVAKEDSGRHGHPIQDAQADLPRRRR